MYIAWKDNATSSSSSSHEDVEANLCLMARENSEVSSTIERVKQLVGR